MIAVAVDAVVLGKIFNNYCHLWHCHRAAESQQSERHLLDAESEADADMGVGVVKWLALGALGMQIC